jgi:hypothetical protein
MARASTVAAMAVAAITDPLPVIGGRRGSAA